MKKLGLILCAILMILSFSLAFACGGEADNGGNNPQPTPQPITYTVTFDGTQMSKMTIAQGDSLQKPTEPEKDGYIFTGWYKEKEYQNQITFPIKIESDTTVYAKFTSYADAFAEARRNTIGENVSSYEYDYTTTATAGFNSVTASGNTQGNAKYKADGEVNFYDMHENSGLLFYDGTKYQIKRGNTLQKLSFNEKNKMTSFESEEVDSSYKFDSSSFAKALFEYSDDQLKSITKTNVKGEYKLTTAFNFSKGLSVASSILNNKLVRKLMSSLPETSVNTGMYVAFADGKVSSYRYEMNINVTNLSFSLVYKLDFKNVGKVGSITTKTFNGLSLSDSEITETTNTINSYINAIKQAQYSSYDYKFVADVDYSATKNGIGTTIQGETQRKNDSGNVYFLNRIEVDSDLKNADLYKDKGVEDNEIKRTLSTTNEVYMKSKGLVFWGDASVQNDYVVKDSDKYFLLDAITSVGKYTFIQTENKSNTETEYTIGLSQNGLKSLLEYFNNSVDLDPLKKASVTVKPYGTFDGTSITSDSLEVTVTVKNGKLSSIKIKGVGDVSTKYEDSRDFGVSKIAEYQIDYSITITDEQFTPYSKLKDFD